MQVQARGIHPPCLVRESCLILSSKSDTAILMMIHPVQLKLKKTCSCWLLIPGMWSRSRRLSLVTVSRRTNVSSRSHLGQNPQRLGLWPTHLGSRLGLDAIASRLGSQTILSRRDVLCRRVLCIAAVRPMKPVQHYSLVRIVRGNYIRSCLLLFRLLTYHEDNYVISVC